MDENNTFFFWEEICKVLEGKQTQEEFFDKFDKAASYEVENSIRDRINSLIDLKELREEFSNGS